MLTNIDAFDALPCGQVSATMFAASSAPVRDPRAEPIPAGAAVGWLKREQAIMGTAIVVELWSDDDGAGERGDRRGDGRDASHRPD